MIKFGVPEAIAVVAIGGVATGCPGQGWGVFNPLPGGNGSGGRDSLGGCISADGTTVVGSVYLPGDKFGAVWTVGSLTFLPRPSGTTSGGAHAVSADGSVVGGSVLISATANGAVFWNRTAGVYVPQLMADIPGGSNSSRVLALSADGSVGVGWGQTTGGTRVARWYNADGSGAAAEHLLGPPGISGSAYGEAISDDASVIAGSIGPTGYRHEGESVQVSGYLGSGASILGLSGDGQRMVGYSLFAGQTFATLWDGATPMLLPAPDEAEPTDWTRAIDVSDDGAVIIGQVTLGTDIRAVVWRDGVPRLLGDLLEEAGADLTGWRISHVDSISADGRFIVGEAFNPDGQLQAYVATIPSPGGMLIVAATSTQLVRRRRPVRVH